MNIKTIAVLGAGTMGRGIVQAFAQNGFPVIFYARREAGVKEGYDYIVDILASLVKKGKLSEADRQATLDRITITTKLEDKQFKLKTEIVEVDQYDLYRNL